MVDNNSFFDAVLFAQKTYPNIRPDLFERLLCDRLNWSKTDYIMNCHHPIATPQRLQFEQDILRLVNGEPLQYIIGFEWFYGRVFEVSSDTLIPRPETELLVETVLATLSDDKMCYKVVDIGTGSGIIGISLALEKPNLDITLSDISKNALAMAKTNAKKHAVNVNFVCSDVFDEITETFDVIVSNPPYIAQTEISVMDDSVIRYEPHIALFAENDGLAIYEKILKQARKHLSQQGMIFLEIGYLQANAIKQLAVKYFPDKTVEIKKDYAGLDRIVIIK